MQYLYCISRGIFTITKWYTNLCQNKNTGSFAKYLYAQLLRKRTTGCRVERKILYAV